VVGIPGDRELRAPSLLKPHDRQAGNHQLSAPKCPERGFITYSTTSGRSTQEQRLSRMGGEATALGKAKVAGRWSGLNQRHPSSPDVKRWCPATGSSSALTPGSSKRWRGRGWAGRRWR
jgi:hypothetical protein